MKKVLAVIAVAFGLAGIQGSTDASVMLVVGGMIGAAGVALRRRVA